MTQKKIKTVKGSTFKVDMRFGKVQKGNLVGQYISKYDKSGNQIKSASYNADGSLKPFRTYQYKYDAAGNWTEEIKCFFKVEAAGVIKEATEITERRITYY